MNRNTRNATSRWILAGVLALAAISAYAVDVVVRPAIGDALSVLSQTDLELFRVAESGEIILPQPPPLVTGSEPLCRAGTGEVVRCNGGGNRYHIVEEDFITILQLPGADLVTEVNCPAGRRVVSGGYWNRSINTDELYVSKNLPNPSGTGWEATFLNASGGSYNLFVRVRVVCANL